MVCEAVSRLETLCMLTLTTHLCVCLCILLLSLLELDVVDLDAEQRVTEGLVVAEQV